MFVAAFTDELDCVAVLEFPAKFARQFDLAPGSRLVTCNQSARIDEGVPSDLIPGCNHTELFTDFCPIFGHFVSSGTERLQQLINNISNDEWERAKQLGQE